MNAVVCNGCGVAGGDQERTLSSDLTVLQEHVTRAMITPSSAYSSSSGGQGGGGNGSGGPSAAHARRQQEEVKHRNDKISAHKAEIGAIERKVTAQYDSYSAVLYDRVGFRARCCVLSSLLLYCVVCGDWCLTLSCVVYSE
jgi:hypothetical protein